MMVNVESEIICDELLNKYNSYRCNALEKNPNSVLPTVDNMLRINGARETKRLIENLILPKIKDEPMKYLSKNNKNLPYTIRYKDKYYYTCVKCSYEQKTSFSTFKYNKGICCVCLMKVTEQPVARLLIRENIEFIKEYKLNGYNYRYDLYLPDDSIIIEIDGDEHLVNKFKNDKAKMDIAIQHNIRLVRIYSGCTDYDFWHKELLDFIDCDKKCIFIGHEKYKRIFKEYI